ncbi:MAG: glycosyltransferase [Erysipelotrichaceae bacterium]|nr:glycosyltransferase [Erysipelotrichaceae bacterium]
MRVMKFEKVNMEKKIAVLIPCLNEAETIAKVISDFKQELPEAEIYVYDNNSTDGTDEIARQGGAQVVYEHKQGKGCAVRSMFRDIEADCYIMTDGDDTYPADRAREMADIILNGEADMVVGDRLSSTYFTTNKRPFHNFGNRLVRFLVNLIFGSDLKDIMSGLRAFSYGFVKTFPCTSDGFQVETEMAMHSLSKKLRIRELPIEYRDRPAGSFSKLNTVRDGFKVIMMIGRLTLKYRPALIYGALSGLAAVIGIILNWTKHTLGAWIMLIAALGLFFLMFMKEFTLRSQQEEFTRQYRRMMKERSDV